MERESEGLRVPEQPLVKPAAASVLLALADRCEREEPSRELDNAIYAAIRGGEWLKEPTMMRTGTLKLVDGTRQTVRDRIDFYTTSLDAAVTLVPWSVPVAYWDMNVEPPSEAGTKATITFDADKHPDVIGEARTPALALCAAALRARAAGKATP